MDQRPYLALNTVTVTKLRLNVVDIKVTPVNWLASRAAPLQAGNADIFGLEPSPKPEAEHYPM
jgi:hypothetical protein